MKKEVAFICTINRSGSSWLTTMLNHTGCIGWAGEPRDQLGHGKINPAGYWEERKNVRFLMPKVNPYTMTLLWDIIPEGVRRRAKFLRLQRRDTWRSAISQYRAAKSMAFGVMVRREDGSREPDAAKLKRHQAVPFDPAEIRATRANILKQNEDWKRWLSAHGIEDILHVEYENLSLDPVGQVRRILQYVGARSEFPSEKIMGWGYILRDPTTERWIDLLGVRDQVPPICETHAHAYLRNGVCPVCQYQE